MTFSQSLLQNLNDMSIACSAEAIGLHSLGDNLFEISCGGNRILLSHDAGIDLAFRLADFLSRFENTRL